MESLGRLADKQRQYNVWMNEVRHSSPALIYRGDGWSSQLANAVSSVETLLERLGLHADELDVDVDPAFPLRVPEAYLARIKRGDPTDPLLLQVLPLRVENETVAGYSPDPLAERLAAVAPGLIRKYAGRALIIAAPTCAVHCRYCFRRSFPYADHRIGGQSTVLQSLRDDPSIREVILSGGDPLILKDAQLEKLVGNLEAIDHVERLRIHTRLPVVIPDRVTNRLTKLLESSRFQIAVVLHINHPNEIDAALTDVLQRLANTGAQLLNQSVLLHRVNDDPNILATLSDELFKVRVLPYYLHLLDKVTGTHHFDVAEDRAREIYRMLRERLPGYLVPRLAREVPGERAKRWL